jgi:ADP-heptose:LPS heptosyltransferase
MRALDLVISIDSMPAHLAGALGVRTWTLLQKDADWRWMSDRTDSPWYPTMRLFRQQQAEDWQPVIAQVKQKLQQLL